MMSNSQESEYVVSIEELCQRRTVKRIATDHAAKQSHGHDDEDHQSCVDSAMSMVTGPNNTKVALKFKEIEDEKQEENKESGVSSRNPKIQKVPMVLRDRKSYSEKYFEPRVVSIGPIHHGKENLKQWEKYKTKFTARFIKSSKEKKMDTTALSFFQTIKENISELRELYDEEVLRGYEDDDELSLMLFVDGCFVLQYIRSCDRNELVGNNKFNIKMDQLVFALFDMFLLENQIPFRVLELLIGNLDGKDGEELMKSIRKFIVENVMAPKQCKNYSEHDATLQLKNSTHLLELLQKVCVRSEPRVQKNPKLNQEETHQNSEEDPKSKNNREETHQNLEKPKQKNNRERTHQNFEEEKSHSIRNIDELKAAWISVEPSKRKTWSLKNIRCIPSYERALSTFYKFKPALELPRLMVDDSMAAKFMNLIAYEMCPDNFRTNYEVTSYICFLDTLIDHPNDVKILRSKNILINLLGSDQEVTDIFNEIATDLVPDSTMYKDVRNELQRLYSMKFMTWMAEAYSTHFSSPWTAMAFLGAVVALFLSGVQTWYTIYPVDE